MKTYPPINGPIDFIGEPCIAFYKYDGSNLRFEWTKKRGFWKFGTRKRLFDNNDEEFGRAIEIFQDTLANPIIKVFQKEKDYRNIQEAIVYCEFYGEDSFAGYHNYGAPFHLRLIDVSIYKKGFVTPRNFINHFGGINWSAEVIYDGNFNRQFIKDVYDGKFPLKEGIVAKGIKRGKGNRLWMAKVKTKWWFDKLREQASNPNFQTILEENTNEQLI